MPRNFFLAAVAVAVAVTGLPALASGPDFEPEVLDRVLAGEIVADNLVTSNHEFRQRFRAYFPKGTPEAFVKLVTNHAAFPSWIPEVKKAETTGTDADGLGWRYHAEIFIDMGIVQQTVTPEGYQRLTPPAAPGDDTLLRNQITNYTDQLQSGEERSRLIPYQSGFLLDETIEAVARQDAPVFVATLVRKELRARGKKLVERARAQLGR